MPYIDKDYRNFLDSDIRKLSESVDKVDRLAKQLNLSSGKPLGVLNYVITKLVMAVNPKSYSDYAALVGMLETMKLEFYRRAVAAYEDKKIKENGDVF